MNRLRLALLALLLGFCAPPALRASDPPHDSTSCLSCHKLHKAPGGTLTSVAGNGNLCISCHASGGSASAKPFATGDLALPTGGLPTGVTAAGTSHRWDSGPQGHATFKGGAATASTGTVTPSGAYAGAYPTTIEIKITVAGNVGTAQFQWRSTSVAGAWGASSANLATASTPVAIPGSGVSVAFANGTGTSFQANDVWHLYLRTELRTPANAEMAVRLERGALMCSTCHDQHSQANSPFDPAAPVAAGLNGRHFQRIPNDRDQMCVDCHNARNQTTTGGTTHPINLPIPVNGNYTTTRTSAKLDTTSKVQCQSCHKVHYAPMADGTLLRVSNAANLLCNDCHTYKTVAAANLGVHFDATSGVVWPGGQYGSALSTYPARTAGERGNCANCHAPHGWPDARNTAVKYAGMLVDERSNLCLACHDSNGPSKQECAGSDFRRHPPPGGTHQRPHGELRRLPQPAHGQGRNPHCGAGHGQREPRAGHRRDHSSTMPRSAVRMGSGPPLGRPSPRPPAASTRPSPPDPPPPLPAGPNLNGRSASSATPAIPSAPPRPPAAADRAWAPSPWRRVPRSRRGRPAPEPLLSFPEASMSLGPALEELGRMHC